jgi:hypothetical protein
MIGNWCVGFGLHHYWFSQKHILIDDKNLHKVGVGMCIQDDEGHFILAKSERCILLFVMWIWEKQLTSH